MGVISQEQETELVSRAKLGDQDAFAQLYKETKSITFRAVRLVLRNYPDAVEDAIQTCYMNAFRSIGRFQGDARFSTWMVAIARNSALMHLRSPQVRRNHASLDETFANNEGDGLHIDIDAEDRGHNALEIRSDLEKIIGQLGSRDREAVLMHWVEGIPMHEIAARWGIKEGAAKSRLKRAFDMCCLIAKGEIHMEDVNEVTKQKCVICNSEGRFRFADLEADAEMPNGEVQKVPLCQWCAKSATRTPATPSRMSIKQRACKHCGEMFTPTGNRQDYAPGHRPEAPHIKKPNGLVKHSPQQAAPVADSDALVTVKIPVSAIDRFWKSSSPAEKAKAFEFMLSGM